MGEHLGYLDLEMQMKQLSLYEENLEEEISRLKEEASVKRDCTGVWEFWEDCFWRCF